MPTKQDGRWVKQSIANTRQAEANARKRAIPKFAHPSRAKPGKTAPPAEPPTEASAEAAAPDSSEEQAAGE